MKKELKEEYGNLIYDIRLVTSLINILTVAIDYNIDATDKLYLLNFSKIIEERLEILTEQMDLFSIKFWHE